MISIELRTILLTTVLFLAIIVFTVRRRKQSTPPGPWNWPILGYLGKLNPEAPYLTLTKLAKEYGPIYGLYLGNIYTVVLSDAMLVKKTFNKDAASGRAPLYLTHGIMKGYGLICAQGELWKDQRKFVHGVLRSLGAARVGVSNRKKMEALIVNNVLEFVQYIKRNWEKIPLDPLEPLRHSLGSIINLIVFGKSWSRDDEIWQWLQHLQEEGTKHIGVAGPLNFLPFLRFLPKHKQTVAFLIDGKLKTHKIYQSIIDEQRDALLDNDDAISNLIQAFLIEKKRRAGTETGKYYSDVQFHHLLADIFGASLDTTLTTLRWHLLYLSVHKDIQTRIHDQIVDICGKTCPSLDDLVSLPYLEASIAETQRIRSVVPVGIPHGTLEPMEIDGFKIPKGSMIVPLQWAIHMDPKIWGDPTNYRPERFINDQGKFFKHESFIPFQTGKRMCVGDELARMFLFLFSAIIIQNFDISCENSLKVDLTGDCGITLIPKPHKLIFTKL